MDLTALNRLHSTRDTLSRVSYGCSVATGLKIVSESIETIDFIP